MIEKFYPTYLFDKVEDIPINLFKKERIKAIIFDMDNTLIGGDKKYSKEVKAWIKEVKRNNIKVYILSNTYHEEKAKKISKELSIPYIHAALKPALKGFTKTLTLLGEKKENTIIIGDQIFTDIYGGNRFGIRSILVKRIGKKEALLTKMKRPIEKMILRKYHTQQLLKEKNK